MLKSNSTGLRIGSFRCVKSFIQKKKKSINEFIVNYRNLYFV